MRKNTSKVHVKTGLVIEKNIPIPESKAVNPFTIVSRDMEVGDSVLLDKVPTSISYTAKRLGYKFRTQKEGDKFRVWRLV